jgi:hypothetical protein
MHAVAAAAREGESRQKEDNPQWNRSYSGDGGEWPERFRSLQEITVREFPAHPRKFANQNPARRNPLEGLGFGCGLGTRRQGTPLANDAINRGKGVSISFMSEPKTARLAYHY